MFSADWLNIVYKTAQPTKPKTTQVIVNNGKLQK